MKKFLDWLRSLGKGSEKDAEAKRERELQRLAKLTKTANLPGLEQEPKKNG